MAAERREMEKGTGTDQRDDEIATDHASRLG